MKRASLVLIVVLALLVPTMTVSATTTYYVRPDGDDGNTGLTNDAAGAWETIQHAIDNVTPGDTIRIAPAEYGGGLVIAAGQDGVTLAGEEGVVILGGSPALTINADGATLLDIYFDGQVLYPTSSGIVVADGVSRLWVERCCIRDWGQDGLTTLGALSGIKLVDNVFYQNGSDGCEFAATPDGFVNIYGNAFSLNSGYGIHNADPAPGADLVAEYNEWGSIDGPSAVNGVSTGVDADPWVYAKMWVEPSPQTVREGEAFSAAIKMDVHRLYGLDVDMTVDTSLFQLTAEPVFGGFKTTTDGAHFGTNGMSGVNSSGWLEILAYRALPDAEYDVADDVLLSLELQANEIATFEETGHIQFDPLRMRLGAVGGINIYLDEVVCGDITVLGTTTIDGVVDLQGRADEAGAIVEAAPGATYAWDPAPDTSDAWGAYGLADMTDDSYDVTIEMARYLDASATISVSGDTQTLGSVTLLGGDANDDDTIDIGDISIIGGQYGLSGASIGDVRADINNDAMIDILDMVLAAGNYQLTESPWTP